MKVLLKIGHMAFLLPDDRGVSALMKTMSRAVPADDRTFLNPPAIHVDAEAVEISIQTVNSKTKITARK